MAKNNKVINGNIVDILKQHLFKSQKLKKIKNFDKVKKSYKLI